MNTPCNGKSALFDSTYVHDHKEAAAICATCPFLAACARMLDDELRRARSHDSGPEGTWAGKLIGRKRILLPVVPRPPQHERIAAEEALYDEAEALRAHNAYAQGDGTDWARVGHRVYTRRKAQARKMLEGSVA